MTNLRPTSWSSYPKVYGLGHPETEGLLSHDVTVEEKVDGSQFSFGVIDGRLLTRSKGRDFPPEEADDLFRPAVATVLSLVDKLHEGWTYRAEAFKTVRHNVLKYGRVPEGNLIVFDINTGYERYASYDEKQSEAKRLGLEIVPRLFEGKLTEQMFAKLLETESVLGEQLIEGIVIKTKTPVYGTDKKAVLAKYVSEVFKESHARVWGEANPGRGSIVDRIIATYRSEARWQKAAQHLRERGELLEAPQDIGNLIQEVNRDFEEEEWEAVSRMIFDDFKKDIMRGVTKGLPEWWKRKLAERAFEE